MSEIAHPFVTNQPDVLHWLNSHLHSLPFYASVDIRYAGFKIAVVDHNLFPAGFNNLSHIHRCQTVNAFQTALNHYKIYGQNLVLLCETHTRNTWYLENIRVLADLIQAADFRVTISMILPDSNQAIECLTATRQTITIHPFHTLQTYDAIILNNDLTSGVPDSLAHASVPIIPSVRAGWHSRLKSEHFSIANQLIQTIAHKLSVDPWLYSTLFDVADIHSINDAESRQSLHQKACALFANIQEKYTEYSIEQRPFIFLKSDQGTYGMGIQVIEHPDEILSLNRKSRNTLSKGKSAKPIQRLLLQEGVPSIQINNGKTAEACIYSVMNHCIGGFYRLHEHESRNNLNKTGMTFGPIDDMPTDLYQLHVTLAQVANVAAAHELAAIA